jgi:hypothetical protein
MKTITQEQIVAVLQAIYNTNIPAQQFDAIKKLFNELPVVEDKKLEPKNE